MVRRIDEDGTARRQRPYGLNESIANGKDAGDLRTKQGERYQGAPVKTQNEECSDGDSGHWRGALKYI